MSQSLPFFSIIVPVYNREGFIGTMIQSVLNQEFEDFELIIVNDGSTDHTEKIVKSFSDFRIRYIKTANSERGAARNAGAEKATGQFFNFFDSDDLMYRNHLKTAHAFIEKNTPSWFHVGYNISDESGRLLTTEIGLKNDSHERLIVTNYLGCDSVFIERSLFLSTRFNSDRRLASSEDWELWLRVISRKQLLACREITFQMTHHPDRSLLTIPVDQVIERDTFMLQVLLNDDSFVEKFKKKLSLFEADRYTFFSLSLILAKRKKEAIAYLWKSIITTPLVVTRRRFWACIKLSIQSL